MIRKLIDQGASAKVYKGTDIYTNEKVAIKIVNFNDFKLLQYNDLEAYEVEATLL